MDTWAFQKPCQWSQSLLEVRNVNFRVISFLTWKCAFWVLEYIGMWMFIFNHYVTSQSYEFSTILLCLEMLLISLGWVRHVTRMEMERNAYTVLLWKPEGRPRCSWEDNKKMDLGERGWGDMNWIDLAQDRDQWRALLYTVIDLRVP
jgi:hypothetical protein